VCHLDKKAGEPVDIKAYVPGDQERPHLKWQKWRRVQCLYPYQRKIMKPMPVARKRTLTYYYLAICVCIRSWKLEGGGGLEWECYCVCLKV
jgi:hypothetical protein